jgi:transposase
MSEKINPGIAVVGIDIGKNAFHVVGHNQRGAIIEMASALIRRAGSH